MTNLIASVNGNLVKESEAAISIMDRGFTLADGVFETMIARRNKVINFEKHFDRLIFGISVLDINIPEKEILRSNISDVLDANSLDLSVIRLTISRGYDYERGLTIHDSTPSIIIRVAPHTVSRGNKISLTVSSIRRNEASFISNVKSLSYVDSVVAKNQAIKNGFDDALLLNTKGNISCATSSNVFVVQGDLVITPPAHEGVLLGVTRSIIMGNVASLGLKMIEQSIKPEIDSFDEVFITNVVSGVTSVSSIDGIQIGSGSNEIANKFLSIYNEIVLSEEFDI